MKKTQLTIITLLLICSLSGCEKLLEEKSDKRLVIPVTVKDFQALFSNHGVMNANFISAGEVSSDDFYLTDSDYHNQAFESDKRLYTWQPDYISRTESLAGNEWYNTYRAIYYCNSVLQGLEENNLSGEAADNIKGQALVFRAARYFDGVQVWAPAYNPLTSETDLGMVLRLGPDINTPSVRSTVQETYDLITEDLLTAISLLPITQPGTTLPTKAAAHGLLARTFLCMGFYEEALEQAKAALAYNSTLIDFNGLDSDLNFPIPVAKESSVEVIFWNSLSFAQPLNASVAKVSENLLNLYNENDLRKEIFFRKNTDESYTFRGTHTGNSALLGGISTSELYLIVAECYSRLGRLKEAATFLNDLLVKRWKEGEFTPITFANKDNALKIIIEERRKELVMRGGRWRDIKRLNRDGAKIELKRTVNDEIFTLPPNDPRYALAISEDVLLNSGIKQNPR